MNGLCAHLRTATAAGALAAALILAGCEPPAGQLAQAIDLLAPEHVARWRPTPAYRNLRVRRIVPK